MKQNAILSLIGLLFTIVLNFLAIRLPINGLTPPELSDLYPNLFVPANITFSIWSIIYLGLIGFTLYFLHSAFRKEAKPNGYLLSTAPWFLISCLANGAWVVAWHYKQVVLAFLIMLVLLFCLTTIYLQIARVPGVYTRRDLWFIQIPFSIYLGWITVATIANLTALLVHSDWSGWGVTAPVWTSIMIAAAVIIGLAIGFRRKDPVFQLVLIWAILGIYLKRNPHINVEEKIITTSAVVGMIVLGLLVAYLIVRPRHSNTAIAD